MAAATAASATIILGDSSATGDVAPKADGAPEPSAIPGHRSSTPIRNSSHDVIDGPDGASIHTTDGRVKNPVPSKLKGKADNKNGNFGVMHIDINSSQAALRNAAAKRTSEETEAAARLANMRGYQSIKRSKLAWNPQTESDPRSSVPAYGASQNGYLNSSYSIPGRLLGPSPQEAKAEQARLLTLLRSLNPMVVVDQLCKALAYFGGIPGAPSSHEFDFPDSGRNNGQGSIFVGWVAEIFPPVEGNPSALALHPSLQSADIASAAAPTAVVAPEAPAPAPAPAQAPALPDSANTAPPPAQPASTTSLSEPARNPPEGQVATGEATATPIKRPRGRPKGSKSSKPRIDKGMKKSDLALHSSSQVDGAGSQLSQSDLGRRSIEQSQNGLANPAYHGDLPGHLDPDSSIMSTPGTGKKRGRPKGSKNRPKNTPEAGQAPTENPHALLPASTSNPITQSPLSHKATESQNNIQSFVNAVPPRSEQQQHPSPPLPESTTAQHAAHIANRAPQGSQATYPAASSWPGGAMQPLDQFRSINNHSHPKKRKGDPAQVARESLATITATEASSHLRQGDDTPLHNATSDQTTMKRRRVSKESHQHPAFNNIDSQSGRVGMTTSPILNNNYNSISQTMTSNGFDTQLASASAAVRQASNQQHLQQQQQQQQPQQQHHHHQSQRSPTQPQGQSQSLQNQPQPHQYTPQRPHAQGTGMRPPPQLQQVGHIPPGSRPRGPSQIYGSSPTGISSQGFYNQARQLPGGLGHAATNSGSFARGSGSNQTSPFGSSSNMARQSSNEARAASLSQQASLAISRSQSGHTPTARHASSDFASSQQVPATSAAAPSTSGLGHFPSFPEHSYLDMDYGLNERDVQDSAAAFGDSTPLDVTLVEPNMRERLYQAMGRP